MRSLFCLANNSLTGANQVICQIAMRLQAAGQQAHVFVWQDQNNFDWCNFPITLVKAESIEKAVSADYDFVFFTHTFLLPLALPYIKNARSVLIYQGHESFLYGKTYQEAAEEKPLLNELLQLPDAIITVSKSLVTLLEQRYGLHAWLVSPGVDRDIFQSNAEPDWQSQRKRILMVGSYLLPVKGMSDGFLALEKLNQEIPLTLVLITQENRGKGIFNQYSFPVELFYRLDHKQVANVIAGCHAFCCPSWYEGLGLPTLEAFCCGLPVVSTHNGGVDDYGVDGNNLLLAEPGNPIDLYEKLKRLLSDRRLWNTVRFNALQTAQYYDWDNSMAVFADCQRHIGQQPLHRTRLTVAQGKAIISRLEKDGFFTPLNVQSSFHLVYNWLDRTCSDLGERKTSTKDAQQQLAEISNYAKQFLGNPKAEYYSSFRTNFDLSRFLLSIEDDEELVKSAKAIFVSRN